MKICLYLDCRVGTLCLLAMTFNVPRNNTASVVAWLKFSMSF
ncbi:hypothetical protein [Rickettsia endosymbiont of Ceutorhynchus obstrictus]